MRIVQPIIPKFPSLYELLLYGATQIAKEVLRNGKHTFKNAVVTIAQLVRAATGTDQLINFLIDGIRILFKEVEECACKQVVTGAAKQVTVRAAASAGWECAKGVTKQALLWGVVVDGALLAAQVCYSIKKFLCNEIDLHTFRCEVVSKGSTAVGSFTGGVAGITAGTCIGATIGSLFPGFGTVLGGMIGGMIGTIVVGTAGSYAGKAVGNKINEKWDERNKVVDAEDKKT